MKNLAILRKFIFGLILLVPVLASAYPKNFSSGSGYQDYSYVGLGNPNEVLAFAEYNDSIGIGTEISYTLYGEYADYIERIRLWARPYESSTATNQETILGYVTGGTRVPATYAFPFDNNRPVEGYGIDEDDVASGAQLLAETTVINSGSLKSTIDLASGQWVIYLTADIKSEDEVSLTLGEIYDAKNYTKIGGVITKVNSTNITTSDALTDGNRVLVTLRKTMFSPYDFYSKYYRIPCITTTSNGTLLAISDARKYHAHDIANDIDMLVRRSTDNGQTWSAPVVVAKGEISGTPSNMNHAQTIGYGDASVASLPNGKVLLCMVKGNSIAAGNEEDSTWVAYRVSDDNGVTWGAEKTIPAALLNNARGCIAPGNMCVVEEGVLKGKVLAAFRSASRHDDSNRWGTDTYHGNIFLIFDPDTGKWTRAYSNDSGSVRYIYNSYYGNSTSTQYSDAECKISNGDDEAVIVEVAEDKFLVSNRYGSGDARTFVRLDISSTPGVETGYKYEATKLTSSGFSATAANGSIIKATDANGKRFIIHAVPQSSKTYNSKSTRTALTIYTTEYDGSEDAIVWTERVCLSDPFGKLEETAQYSSMTLMADGTVGLLFEEYPQAVYATKDQNSCANSDFIMRSVFMNVRPQDLIKEWGDVDYIDVAAPVITPESQTYHSEAGEQRPTVTITNPNVDEDGNLVGTTTYSMLYKKSDGTTVTLYDNVSFTDGSKTIEWRDIAAKLGIDEGAELPTNESIIVTAKCSVKSGDKTYTSTETQRNYLFQNPVRKVMIYARPVSGSGVGNPTIVAGSQTAGPGEIITVGVGAEVNITAFSATENPMITFSHFAYPSDTGTDKKGIRIVPENTDSLGWISTADVKLMAGDRQLVFNMLDAETIPNNHSTEGIGFNDVLVLYVFYKSEKAGFKSQIITSGYEIDNEGKLVNNSYGSALSTDDNLTEGFTGVDVVWRKVIGYNDDTKTAIWQDKDTTLMFLNEYSKVTLSYVKSESDVNFKMQDTIVLPKEAAELHLNVAVQPDLKTAQNLNAVVMFIQNGRYLTQEDGSYLYALLEGQLHPHDKNDPIYKGASMVVPWYGLNSNGVYSGMVGQPTLVSSLSTTLDNDSTIRGIKFYNMDNYLGGQLRVYVMIYAISNLVTDINTVVNTSTTGTSAMFVHAHGIKQAAIATAVEEVVENDLIIASVAGGVQFIGYEERVDVYSMMGTLVATFPLNGVRYVELPKGVYIANGKKFVVR